MGTEENKQEHGLRQEYWLLARPIILHGLLLLTLLLVFLGGFGVLKLFAAAGVDEMKIKVLDDIDYFGSATMMVILTADMLFKAVVICTKVFTR